MASKQPARPVGRPRDEEKTEAILTAGWDEFLRRGVHAASLEAIARTAGVSRVTLYRQFPDKMALFQATVQQQMERLQTTQLPPDPSIPLRDGLIGFGLALMRYLTSPSVISFYSALAGDLRRHPDLARAFYEHGPAVTLSNLTYILTAAQQRGELWLTDPREAAEQLIGMWQGLSNYRLALDVDTPELIAGLETRVRNAVDVFLAAYSRP